MRALIADGDADRREALRAELVRHGHDVLIAADTREALARAGDVTLVFAGARLGDDSAVELCRALRGLPGGEGLVVVVVGAEEELDVDAALAAGATDVWPPEVQGLPTRLAVAEHHARVQVENLRLVGVQGDVTVAEEAEQRSAFLASASPLLDASLDLRSTLDALVRLSVPKLGDVCLVDVLDSGEVRRVAYAAADPATERLLRALPRTYAIAADGTDPVARVLGSRRSEITHGQAAAVFGGLAGALGHLAPRNAMLVPLVARGEPIGVLAIGTANEERLYDDEDLALASDLASRAALALDNARLFERQKGVAAVLQESLLPERLPEADGIALGAAYRPAGDGTVVGGDFYDAFRTADGSLALVIGDVSGKGARAAALTGMTRHTLRTAAQYERAPSRILAALNAALIAQRARRGKYCTVALCRFGEPGPSGTIEVEIACAGHPLPLVLRSDGTVEPVGQPGTLLGYVPDPTLHDTRAVLEPGDALVLYTDGITEARTREGLLGDERLASLLRACAGLDAQAIAGRLERAVVQVQDGPPRDDVAIAVARVAPTAQSRTEPDSAAAPVVFSPSS